MLYNIVTYTRMPVTPETKLASRHELNTQQSVLYYFFLLSLLFSITFGGAQAQAPSENNTIPPREQTALSYADLSCAQMIELLESGLEEVFGDSLSLLNEVRAAAGESDVTGFSKTFSPAAEVAASREVTASWAIEALGLTPDTERIVKTTEYSRTVELTTTAGLRITLTTTRPTLLSADSGVPNVSGMEQLLAAGSVVAGPDLFMHELGSGSDCSTLDGGHAASTFKTAVGSDNFSIFTNLNHPAREFPLQMIEVKVLHNNSTNWNRVVEAIILAGKLKVNMLKLSLGGKNPLAAEKAALQRAIEFANQQGVLVLMSAGNIPVSDYIYPACLAVPGKIITYASALLSDGQLSLARQNSMGCAREEGPKLAIPGEDLPTLEHDGTITYKYGSSHGPYPLAVTLSEVIRRNPGLAPDELANQAIMLLTHPDAPENSYHIPYLWIPADFMVGDTEEPESQRLIVFLPLISNK